MDSFQKLISSVQGKPAPLGPEARTKIEEAKVQATLAYKVLTAYMNFNAAWLDYYKKRENQAFAMIAQQDERVSCALFLRLKLEQINNGEGTLDEFLDKMKENLPEQDEYKTWDLMSDWPVRGIG